MPRSKVNLPVFVYNDSHLSITLYALGTQIQYTNNMVEQPKHNVF